VVVEGRSLDGFLGVENSEILEEEAEEAGKIEEEPSEPVGDDFCCKPYFPIKLKATR